MEHGIKKTVLCFAGLMSEVDIQINGYDENEIPQKARETLVSFIEKMDKYSDIVGPAILSYYNSRRQELGYDVEDNIDYPIYDNPELLLKTLNLIGVTILYQDDYDEEAVFFSV